MTASGSLEVAHIVRAHGGAYLEAHRGQLSRGQRRALWAIEHRRTATLGGHVYECAHRGARKIVYNSCRNRHCPKCQSLAKERWLEKQKAQLLPVPYSHVVFTLPAELHGLAQSHPRLIYDLLFRCASQTLLTIAADPRHLGARIGILGVLHTWGQKLNLHPHLHCLVPAGGLSIDGDWWVRCRKTFFLPVPVLSRLFRGKLLAGLRDAAREGRLHLADRAAFEETITKLANIPWMVYSKPPFGGPEQVLQYLARYTHRIAITNQRLVRLDGDQVTFRWKDYAAGQALRELTLPAPEFLRRFLLHVLPDHFVRIRSYGLLANRNREAHLALCRKSLPPAPAPQCAKPCESWRDLLQKLTGQDPALCPHCGQAGLREVEALAPENPGRAPP